MPRRKKPAARKLSTGVATPSKKPIRLRLTKTLLRLLLDAGFRHKDAAYAGFLLVDYVTMVVLEETQYANEEGESTSQDSSASDQNWVKALPENEYPSIVALADELTEPDADERFRFGIEILRNGLEAHLAKRSGSG